MPVVQSFGLQGGQDLITPPIQMPPGRVIAGINYEPHPRGYRRIDGHERIDGRPRPSQQSYWILNFDGGSAAVSEDDVVTGATSGATGRAVVDGVVLTGTTGGGDAAGYLVLTQVTGQFEDNEALQVSAANVAVADGIDLQRAAENDTNDSTWLRSAIEKAREDITAVPGSGPVRGVWFYKGNSYAFRDNAGGTAGVMYRSTSGGWVAQSLGLRLGFTGGGSANTVESGDEIEGVTSGATATVERVVLQSGSWSGGDAAGYFVISGQTGTFVAENIDDTTKGGSNDATIAGDSTAISLPAGGKYRFDNYNFFGSAGTERMYGVNGVGTAFEWDGSIFVPIETGMESDTPSYVAAHRNHLFLSFDGSVQFSGIGDPYSWTLVLGAGELGIGETITGLLGSVSGALAIFGRNRVSVLFGTSAADFELRILADDSGAIADTAQTIGQPIYHDNVGIRSMESTDTFGDFNIGTLTRMVEPIFRVKRISGVSPAGSMRVRDKDTYRLFWSDGTGMSIYFGRSQPEILFFDTGKSFVCFASGKDTSGEERLLAGADDGMVYELDAGTSYDGEAIDAFLRLPFNNVGSPAQRKRWNKVTVEVDSGPQTQLGLTVEYGYADPDQPPSAEQQFTVRGEGGFWNEFVWDQFYWSSPVEGQAEAHIDGVGRNLSVTVISTAIYEDPHILHGVVLQFNYRGVRR